MFIKSSTSVCRFIFSIYYPVKGGVGEEKEVVPETPLQFEVADQAEVEANTGVVQVTWSPTSGVRPMTSVGC